MQKISFINNIDPYTMGPEDFNSSVDELPNVGGMEIIIYFAVSNSFFSGEQIRSYKALEAFKYYEAGFVLDIKCAKIMNNFVVLGEVRKFISFYGNIFNF